MAFDWWCGLLLGLLFGWLSHALTDWFLGLRRVQGRLGDALSGLESEREQLRRNFVGLERQHEEAVSVQAGLERQALELRSRLVEFDANAAELAACRLALKDFDALAARVPVLQADLSHFKTRASELEAQVSGREAERTDLIARLGELEPLRARVDGLGRDLAELEARKQAELARFRQRAEVAEAARPKLEESLKISVTELGSVRAKLELAEQAQGRLPELEVLVASMQAKLGESQGLAALLQSRDTEIAALQTRLTDAQADQSRAARLEQQLAELLSRIAALEGERDRMKRELSDRENDLFDLAGKLNVAQGFEARVKMLENDLTTRDGEIGVLRASQAQHEALNLRISELEKDLEEARARLVAAETGRSQLSLLESQHEALSTQITEPAPMPNRMADLEIDLGTTRANLDTTRADLDRERAQWATLVREFEAQRSRSAEETAKLRVELEQARMSPDDLTKVDGIGAVFARRLKAAGITRFAHLAQSEADQLRAIISPEDWQKIEFEYWKVEAAMLARGETPPKRARALERLARITGIGDIYEKRLHDAGISTYAQLAATSVERLMVVTGSESRTEAELWLTEAGAYAQGKRPSREREKVVRSKLSDAEDQLERLRLELRRAESLRRDRFEVMTQIGEAKQRRLYGAGIYSFEDLAGTPESRLRQIFEHEELDYRLIVREAAEYARGQIIVVKGHRADRFERLSGVSEGDARALYAAGVYSFEELSQLSSPRLHEIIGRDGLDGWIAESGLFATGQAEIEFLDAGRRHRDQLWRIDGIGEVFEGRLNRAGIFSFADVADANPQRLAEIINPQAWEQVDAPAWIAQARELGAREERE